MPDSPTPQHSVSVAAAIFDSGVNVLLIKRRDNGRWEPPGGVLEVHETIEEGLSREVREETGAEIEIDQLTGVYKNMTAGIVALVRRARAISEPRTETPEAMAVQWVPLADVEHLTAPAYAVRVRGALANPQLPPAVRAHDGFHVLDKRA